MLHNLSENTVMTLFDTSTSSYLMFEFFQKTLILKDVM